MASGDGSHVHEKKNASPKCVGLSPGQCYILVVYSLTGLQVSRAPLEVFAFVTVKKEVQNDLAGETVLKEYSKSTWFTDPETRLVTLRNVQEPYFFHVLHKYTSKPVKFVLVMMRSDFDIESKLEKVGLQHYSTDSNGTFRFFYLEDKDLQDYGLIEPDAKAKKKLEEACKKYCEDLKNKDLAQE